MDGTAGIRAIPYIGLDGSLNITGVTQPEWKRCRIWIYETNCLVSGEDDAPIRKERDHGSIQQGDNGDLMDLKSPGEKVIGYLNVY